VRRSVLVGSIAVHAAIGALLYGVARRAPEAPPRAPIDLEIVPPARTEIPALSPPSPGSPPSSEAPGAAPAPAPRAASAPRPAPAAAPAPAAPAAARPERLAISGYDREIPAGARRTGGGTVAGASSGDGDGDGRDSGRGLGSGLGLGGGLGSGLGLGGGLGPLPALPAPPAPPRPPPPPLAEKPASKARPPKLIYPARDRQGDESETFVARVTIDTDGYVVGARLVHGIGGSRDDLASQLVWRFRYAPALDDGGRAIRATIDQPFLVGY
jgi:hypothetical protein